MTMKALAAALCAALLAALPASAELIRTPDARADDAAGPYDSLIISGAKVIDGSGAPPYGPVDIRVEGDRIAAMGKPGTLGAASRTISADGMFVLPGFVDTHVHTGDPQKAPNADYAYRLWLAHGVTSARGVPLYTAENDAGLSDSRRQLTGTLTAPRLFPYAVLGSLWDGGPLRTEEDGRRWVRWAKERGYPGMKIFHPTSEAVMAGALDEAKKVNFGSVAHLGQLGVAEVNARKAVELGLGGITHFYGHFESLLDGNRVQTFPAGYNYNDEQDRFSHVADLADQIVEPGSERWNDYLDFLLEKGVTLSPTFNIYSASRDVMRTRTFEWHDEYTLPSLMAFYTPSPDSHGSYYLDWSTGDEVKWRRFYRPFMQLVDEYQARGGRVTAGSDPGFIYQTFGFAYIGELEMLQEAGLTPLEVIRAATIDGAKEIYEPLGEEAPMGLVRAGMLADLIVVPENPLSNFKTLYGTKHLRLSPETGEVERIGGVKWTIVGGKVYDAEELLADVRAMVAAAKSEQTVPATAQ